MGKMLLAAPAPDSFCDLDADDATVQFPVSDVLLGGHGDGATSVFSGSSRLFWWREDREGKESGGGGWGGREGEEGG